MPGSIHPKEAPPLGTVVGGEYELRRFLGAGGMGAVYEAVGPDDARVAVKVLLEGIQSDETISRFRREANIAATVDSPHVAPALAAGVDGDLDLPFMVLPLYVGLDLKQLLDRIGAVQPAVVARIVRQACCALSAAHEHGIVHRDIKPANIYLDQARDGTVTVRVLDFGIAKLRGPLDGEAEDLTTTGSLLGTPAYMAPEQCRSSKSVGAACDLWSLGVTMYEALTGEVPFPEADTLGELYLAVMTQEVTPIQERAPWVDPGLAVVVHGCLLRDPLVRCPSSAALADALEPFTGGDDVLTSYMLEPIARTVRQHVAPAAELPERWMSQVTPPSEEGVAITVADSDPLLGHALASKYTLLRCLGQGGMGAVYEAEDADGNRYAVKVIKPDVAGKSTAVRRFVREARATMSIDSPHVVRIVEADTDPHDGLPFIVMEMLHGRDLAHTLLRHGAMPPTVVTRLFSQACRGIAAAHEAGLIHRDIKPANLFLHELPSGEIVTKICDFGIVKREDDDAETVTLTRAGGVVGSPQFMSPEQARNKADLDLRTDVWSLGVSLFQTLTGLHPWPDRETMGDLIVAICTDDMPHVQDRAPWIEPGLAAVVHRAMSRDREERFDSMADFDEALEPFTFGTSSVSVDDLMAVSPKLRLAQAPRSAGPVDATLSSRPPSAEESATATAGTAVSQTLEPPMTGGARRFGLAGFVLAAAVVGAVVAFSTGPTPSVETPAATALPAEATARTGEPMRVAVAIEPADAQVVVDGERRELDDGRLALRGRAGDSFVVRVADGDRELEQKVVITGDGEALPETLTLDDEDAPMPEASAPPPKPAPAAPRQTPPPRVTSTAVAAPPPPAGVTPKDDW